MRFHHQNMAFAWTRDGSSRAVAVLLLHGLSGISSGYDEVVDDLGASADVFRLDLRGHGRSDHAPGTYSVPFYTEDVIAFIEEVSRLLPDNTWVNQMDVKTAGKNREVQVTGETASASKLIEIFEQSTVLQNAAPKGAVTRGSTPGTERFMIVAEARPRTVPPPRPLAEVADSLPNAAPPPAPAPPVMQPPVADVEVPAAPPKGAAPPPAKGGPPPKGR